MPIRACHLLICVSLASGFAPPRLPGTGARSGGVAVSGSDDESVRVWSLDGGACVATLKGGFAKSVVGVALARDGGWVAGLSKFDDTKLVVWRPR